jgi:hypothetical protein
MGKKAAQRLGVLGLLNRRNGLSVRNGVLLYKQLQIGLSLPGATTHVPTYKFTLR